MSRLATSSMTNTGDYDPDGVLGRSLKRKPPAWHRMPVSWIARGGIMCWKRFHILHGYSGGTHAAAHDSEL
jgi:hypothetical protein